MSKPPSKHQKSTSGVSADLDLPANSVNQDISFQENTDSAAITLAVGEIEELSDDEQTARLHLERKVERAFFEAGKALSALRDRRLYRSTHRTFEEYCRDRFGHSRQKSNYLIAADDVYKNLLSKFGD